MALIFSNLTATPLSKHKLRLGGVKEQGLINIRRLLLISQPSPQWVYYYGQALPCVFTDEMKRLPAGLTAMKLSSGCLLQSDQPSEAMVTPVLRSMLSTSASWSFTFAAACRHSVCQCPSAVNRPPKHKRNKQRRALSASHTQNDRQKEGKPAPLSLEMG